jgi:uncharacterized protein
MKQLKSMISMLLAIFLVSNVASAQKQFKALLINTTRGWMHTSGHTGVTSLQALADRNNFELVIQESPTFITDKNLEQFQVVIFLNTTGDIFDSASQKAFERYIQSGKGYVGIHSASDTEYDWPWYNQLVGRMFHIHPVIQTAKLKVVNDSFPGMKAFTNNQLWTDEWYEFGPEKANNLKYILAVDEKSYAPKVQWGPKVGNGMGSFHPLAWYHTHDGGRAFYTALGHLPSIYNNQQFLDHVYGGILWAATGKGL